MKPAACLQACTASEGVRPVGFTHELDQRHCLPACLTVFRNRQAEHRLQAGRVLAVQEAEVATYTAEHRAQWQGSTPHMPPHTHATHAPPPPHTHTPHHTPPHIHTTTHTHTHILPPIHTQAHTHTHTHTRCVPAQVHHHVPTHMAPHTHTQVAALHCVYLPAHVSQVAMVWLLSAVANRVPSADMAHPVTAAPW